MSKYKFDPNPIPRENAWIRPVRDGYRMTCCDCGAVHEMDFRAIPWGRGHKVIFRARRPNHPRSRGISK